MTEVLAQTSVTRSLRDHRPHVAHRAEIETRRTTPGLTPRDLVELTRAIDVGSVFDPNHADHACVLVETVSDSVRATPSGSIRIEFTLQRFADPFWFFAQRPDHELNDRRRDTFGQPRE